MEIQLLAADIYLGLLPNDTTFDEPRRLLQRVVNRKETHASEESRNDIRKVVALVLHICQNATKTIGDHHLENRNQ